MRILITNRKRVIRNEVCSDCGIIINKKSVKSMKCRKCGKIICYKCNTGYMCNSCYCDERIEYYKDTPIVQDNVIQNG